MVQPENPVELRSVPEDVPPDSNEPPTVEDAERLCAELKDQISRAQRLVDRAKTFLEATEHEPPNLESQGDP